MHLPRLAHWLRRRVAKRLTTSPDTIIGGLDDPYLKRWYLTPWSKYFRSIKFEDLTRWQRFVRCLPNVYLHLFLRSDDPRALHDHPWAWGSFLIKGSYYEILDETRAPVLRLEGTLRFNKATTPHRIVLRQATGLAQLSAPETPCVTIFMTWRLVRVWGFYCPKGWVPFWRFTKPGAQGETGPGCDG